VGLATVVDLALWAEDPQLRGGGGLPHVMIPVAIVLVHSTLLVRHRYPRSVLAAELAFALVSCLAVPQLQPVAGLLVAWYAVASRRPPRESALWLIPFAVVFGAHGSSTAASRIGDTDPTFVFAFIFLVWLLIATAVWVVGRRQYASARRAWRLRELQAAEAEEAVRAERLRLARELHDIVSHGVTGMMLQAAGAQALARPVDERLQNALTVIEATGVQALSELHRMLGLLRAADPGSEVTERGPTVADISTLVRLAEDAGRDVRLVQVGTPGPLDPSVATAAYRAVQEALTNSSKYAGSSAEVVVELDWRADVLDVTVTDRSGGPPGACRDALSSGHGLPGLTERITLVGGALSSGPTREGFALTARLPRPGTPPAAVVLDAVS
jgi:signal transduction histidine kinase